MSFDSGRSRRRSPRRVLAKIAALCRNFGRSEGQALTEFALLSPLAMLLIFGGCLLGVGLDQYLVLSNATQVGAQQLSIGREEVTDPCKTVYTAVTNAAPNLNSANLAFTIAWNGTTYVSGASGSSNVSCIGSTKTYSQGADVNAFNLSQSATLTVTVTYPFSPAVIGWGSKSITLSSTVQEVIQ